MIQFLIQILYSAGHKKFIQQCTQHLIELFGMRRPKKNWKMDQIDALMIALLFSRTNTSVLWLKQYLLG